MFQVNCDITGHMTQCCGELILDLLSAALKWRLSGRPAGSEVTGGGGGVRAVEGAGLQWEEVIIHHHHRHHRPLHPSSSSPPEQLQHPLLGDRKDFQIKTAETI